MPARRLPHWEWQFARKPYDFGQIVSPSSVIHEMARRLFGARGLGLNGKNVEFEIWLVWSDRRVTVPADTAALDALINAGIPIEPGCRTGSCAECATTYVEGDVIHKDSCLSEAERENTFCPCVSRARGTLVLPF